MIEKLIAFSIKQRLFIVLTTLLVCLMGVLAYRNLAIDVFPDPSPPLVQVYTESPGMAPEEIERLISYPVESAMFGIPRVKNIRSISTYAMSLINVYFEDKTDIYWARQLVSQRLLEVKDQLPQQVHESVLGPIATGLGLVYLYYLESDTHPAIELRTIQDWLIKYEIKSVPEVSQVLSIGGDVKQYHILIDPNSLLKFGITISDVIERVKENNQNTGASFITKGEEEYIVRSVGLFQSLEDLENTVVANFNGTPIYLKNIGEVKILPAIRRGAALVNGEGEKVVGMVLKLFGSNTAEVIRNLEARIAEVNKTLPEGVRIVPFYNQASLVKKCFSTVSINLILGIILVIIVLFLFMGDFPSAMIAVFSLPFSILFAFILMERIDLAADLISFGGLAIAIGLIADASIIMIENINRQLQSCPDDKTPTIIAACREVGRPLFFAISIIILVFLPIFTLTGVEGIMFRPMGYTISFALFGSLLFAMIGIPALSYLVLRKDRCPTREPFLIRNIRRVYDPLFELCRRHRKMVFAATLLIFLSGISLIPFMGREYIPYLEEGTLHLRATMDPNISLEQAVITTTAIERTLKQIPEISGILSRIGRGEVGSHAHFVNDAEILIQLKPMRQWKRFRSKDELIHEIEHRLEVFPGLNMNMTQPIAHNLDELLTGVKAQLAVKLYGSDYEVLKNTAAAIQEVLEGLEGAADVQIEQFTGQNNIQIVLERDRIARYGIDIKEVQETIESAIGGITVGQIYEGQRRFDIFLRFAPEYRKDIGRIENLLLKTPGGGQIPLAQLAKVEETIGSRVINREGNRRYITIQCNIRGRDIGSFVGEARSIIERTVSIPPEYMIKWGGQFELQLKAYKRLTLIMPLTIALVVLLLFTIFYSFQEVLIILINIPLALTGGLLALKASGLYLSVPASIGFIAIFGIALEDGLVLLSKFHTNLKQGLSLEDSVKDGVAAKLRPVLMTSFTTIFGVLPLLLARGPGAEIQRPLATVVVGGLLTSTLVTLIVLPLIFMTMKRSRIQA